MSDKLLKIQMNIKGQDVEIADSGPISPGFYGIDDPVHINGK